MFSVQREKKKITSYLPLVFLLAILILVGVAASSIYKQNSDKELDILERALNRSITQCYAIEGAYPSSLDYLVKNYGLTYDTDHYFIDYQYIGANLRPDTTIIERD